MSDIKIDTFRSFVFDKTLSDEETESETIDDFSQHSDMNNLMADKLSVNSRSETPIFKNVSIVVSRNDNEIDEKVSQSPSLIEEKDNSEDLMVEISKKTTIKKIISKTTLVNGITKASEFEEFIIKDAHISDHSNKHQKIKFDKEHAYVEFQKALSDKITNEESVKSHKNQENFIYENIKPVYVENTWRDRKLSNKSSESFSDNLGESRENFNGKSKSQSQNYDKFSESSDHGRKKYLNCDGKFNEKENSNGKLKSQSENTDSFSESSDHGRKKDLNCEDKFNEKENSNGKLKSQSENTDKFSESSDHGRKKDLNCDNKPVHVQNTWQDKKFSNKSSESFSDNLGESKESFNGKSKSQSQNTDKFSEYSDHGRKKDLNCEDKFNEKEKSKVVNQFSESKDLNPVDQLYDSKKQIQDTKSKRNFKDSDTSTEKIMPTENVRENGNLKNEKENSVKTKTPNNYDNKLRKEKTSLYGVDNNNDLKKQGDKKYKDYILDYKIRKFNDKNNFTRPYNSYNETKGRDKRSRDYYNYRDLKLKDSKPVFNDTLNSNFKHEEKNIKWVDPFKSYHLKYDLKDNGRSIQDWIKQKQEALNRSSSKNSVNNKSLTCKSAAITKSFPIVSPNIKGSSHKDIKEFITRGNIKENLFRFRHPPPEFVESEYSLQQSYTDKDEFKRFNNRVNLKSFESLNGNKKTDEFMSEEKSNSDFNLQDSEVWNDFDSIEPYMEPTPANLRDQDEIDIYRGCCRGTSCCSPYYSCYNCLCMPCNCLLLNENHIKTPKYTTYESPKFNLVDEKKTTNFNSRNLMYHSSPKAFNRTNDQFYSEESEMNKQISTNREIDILENKLNSIENKIRNIKLNGPNVYDCEMDLECQRRDMEKKLDCLYMFLPNGSIKT